MILLDVVEAYLLFPEYRDHGLVLGPQNMRNACWEAVHGVGYQLKVLDFCSKCQLVAGLGSKGLE